jgi:hypothetical protein
MACKGCERRRQWIKTVIGGAVVGFLAPKMIWAYQTATGDKTIPVELALGFVRTMNVVHREAANFHQGVYQPKETFIRGMLHHKSHDEIGSPMAIYMNVMNTGDFENILPGWRLDMAIEKDGYVAILEQKGGGIAFVTDDYGEILMAPTDGKHPAAKELRDAHSFPGAVGYKPYMDAANANFGSRFFRTAAYRIPTDPCDGCPAAGCVHCVSICCLMDCWNTYPPDTDCYFNCGQLGNPGCIWGSTNGGTFGDCLKCRTCATRFKACCACAQTSCHQTWCQ